MSRQCNTDGMMVFPADNGEPITLNAFESIECAIAFDVRDLSEDRRSAWIYAIVFGCDDEDSWNAVATKFGWDEEDRKRANMMHEQWIKAKEKKEQPEVVMCKGCRYGQKCTDGKTTYQCFKWNSNEFGALHEQDWYCADGEGGEANDNPENN